MSHYGRTPDFIRSWLDDEPPELPDQVIRDALGRISEASGRRSTSRPGRTARMSDTVFSATKFVVAGAIVVLAGGVLLSGVLIQPDDDVAPAAITPASPSPPTSYAVRGEVMSGKGGTTSSMATDDALWVPYPGGLVRIDMVTSPKTTFPELSEVRLLASTEDAVWAVEPETVHRIDRARLTVTDTIDLGSAIDWGGGQPHTIADGSLWLTTSSTGPGSPSLIEIGLAERAILGEYSPDGGWLRDGYDPELVAIGNDIWVYSWDESERDGRQRLTRFDLETRDFIETFDIAGSGSRECCIALDDAIWLVTPTGTLRRFDLATLEVTDTLVLDADERDGPQVRGGIVADGAIWVSGSANDQNSAGNVYRIDPETRAATDVITVGLNPEPPAFLHGAIWVANHSDRTLSRIDVESRQVTDTLTLGRTHLHTPLASDGVIWVYTEEGSVHRIDAVAATE